MARKKITTENKLDELIPSYAKNKEQLDYIKSVCDDENKQIKDLLGDKKSYEAGGYKVTKSVQNRDTMDEELLCVKLSEFNLMYELGIIKVQEYVDMSALEDAMYKKLLTSDIISVIEKCRKHKEVVTLRVSKVKEKEE